LEKEMSGLNEAGSTLFHSNLDLAQRCARLMLEGGQKLCQLQLDAAKAMLSGSGRLAAEGAQIFQEGVQKSVEAARAFIAATVELQAELARAGQDVMPLFSRQFADAIEQVARVASSTTAGVTPLAAAREEETAAHRARRAA
jgi:hypothetical protein